MSQLEGKASHRLSPVIELKVIGYASGNFAKALQAGIVDIFYMYFLVNTIHLPASVAGTVLLAGFIFDGITDPVVSRLIDKYGYKFKSLTIILLFLIPVNVISFFSLFLLPLYLESFPFLTAIVASLFFRLGYTLVDIPHNALLAGMAKQTSSTSISAWRFCFSAVSVLFLAGLSTFPLFNPQISEPASTGAIIQIMIVVGIVYLLTIIISAISCRSVKLDSQTQSAANTGFLAGLKHLLTIPDYIRLLKIIACICCFLAMAERSTVFLVGFSEAKELDTWELLAAVGTGKLVSLLFWVKFANRSGERKSFKYAHAVSLLTVFFILIAYPEHNHLLVISYFILGISVGGVSVFIWSLLAQVVNKYFTSPERNLSTLAFGIFLLVLKVSAGIGSFILAVLLEGLNDHEIDSQQNILSGFVVISVVFAALLNISIIRRLSDRF